MRFVFRLGAAISLKRRKMAPRVTTKEFFVSNPLSTYEL